MEAMAVLTASMRRVAPIVPPADDDREDGADVAKPVKPPDTAVMAVRRRLPHVEFKESELETDSGSRKKSFTKYTMHVSLLGHTWTVSKRYSQFDELRAALEKAYVPHVVAKEAWPAFPQKRILGNFDANVISTRSQGLQTFVQQLLLLSPVCDDRALLDFIQAPQTALTSSAIDAGRRRFYRRVCAWHAAPSAPAACTGVVSAHDLAAWAWERGLENCEPSDVWSKFAAASLRLDPRAPLAAVLAQARVRGRRVRRQLQHQHACATLVQQCVRQRHLSSASMLSSDSGGQAVRWQLRGISAISPSRARDVPMFRCTSAPFLRLGCQWQICAHIDRSADTVGLFLRKVVPEMVSSGRGAVSFLLELVAHGPGGQVELAQHRMNDCKFEEPQAHDDGGCAAAWGKLSMASLQHVRSTAVWCDVYARATVVSDPAALNEAAVDARTPPRGDGNHGSASSFVTPPSSVHPSLQGSGQAEELSPGIDDGAEDRDVEEATFRDLHSGPVHSGDESPRTMLDFPALGNVCSQQQQAEMLSPQVAALLDSARLGGCTAALVRLGVRTRLDLGDVTDDDLTMLGLSTLEVRRFARLRQSLEAEVQTQASAEADTVTNAAGLVPAMNVPHDDTDHVDTGRQSAGIIHDVDLMRGVSRDQAVASRDDPEPSQQLPVETSQVPSIDTDVDAAEATAAIQTAAAMRARLAAMITDMED